MCGDWGMKQKVGGNWKGCKNKLLVCDSKRGIIVTASYDTSRLSCEAVWNAAGDGILGKCWWNRVKTDVPEFLINELKNDMRKKSILIWKVPRSLMGTFIIGVTQLGGFYIYYGLRDEFFRFYNGKFFIADDLPGDYWQIALLGKCWSRQVAILNNAYSSWNEFMGMQSSWRCKFLSRRGF